MSASSLTIGLMKKQKMVRDAFTLLINQFENCKIVFEACNGEELKQKMIIQPKPTVLILELEVPIKNAFKTLDWLQGNFSEIPVILLSDLNPELMIIDILRKGVRAFLKIDAASGELKKAITEVSDGGFYFAATAYRNLIKTFSDKHENMRGKIKFSEKELLFLELSCTELTYKEIADRMKVKEKNIEKLRANLFENLKVKSRTGLTAVAVRNGIAAMESTSIAAA